MSALARNKLRSFKNLQATTALAVVSLLVPGAALADGVVSGTFVSGSGSFNQEANKTTITVHTTKSITEFKDYNIPEGDEVHYQHDADIGHSQNLSRVTTGNTAHIMGSLTSDDVDVFLIDQGGVVFGKNSRVNVPNLIVSTTDMTNANFNAGRYVFDKPSSFRNAKIINNGTITVDEGGLAAFVAPGVINNGVIVAHKGKVALAAGDQFTLDMYGDKLVNFAVSEFDKNRLVKQSGRIAADGGVVLLTVQDANKVVSNVVNLSGVTEAKDVKVYGDTIILGGASKTIAADGNNGGTVNIKGRKITTKKGSQIIADATTDGDGGEAFIKADDNLDFDGEVSAQGKGNGKGGNVETSGSSVNIGEDTVINTLDEKGGAGTWLIDPTNIKIIAGNGSSQTTGTTTVQPNANDATSTIGADKIANTLKTSNVTVQTLSGGTQAGDLEVASSINVTPANGNPVSRTLTLKADHDIKVDDGVSIGISGAATPIIVLGHDINPLTGTPFGLGVNLDANNDVILGSNVHITTQGGAVNVNDKAGTGYAHSFTSGAGSVIDTTGGGVKVAGVLIPASGNVNIKAGTVLSNSIINANRVTFQSTTGGDITSNGHITASDLADSVDMITNGGTITVAGGIDAGAQGALGKVNLSSPDATGVVRVLSDITVGADGTANIVAGDHIDLDGKISSTGLSPAITTLLGNLGITIPADLAGLEILNITGSAPKVNVLSNKGIINQGVKLVNDGGTVNLGADTFDQYVHINKNLTLNGVDGTKIAPTSASPLLISNYQGLSLTGYSIGGFVPTLGSLPVAVQPIVFVDGGASGAGLSNVTINKVEVDGTNTPDTLLGGKTGIAYYNASGLIENSSVHGLYDKIPTATGIYVDGGTGGGLTLAPTTVLNTTDSIHTDAAVALPPSGHTVTVDNSDIYNYQLAGVHANGSDTTVNITNSRITGDGLLAQIAQVGVLFDVGANGSVKNSKIKNNFSLLSAGVAILNGGTVTVEDNEISNNETGITAIGTNGVVTSGNDIHDNGVGVLISTSDEFSVLDSDIHENGVGIDAENSNNLTVDPTYIHGNLVGINLNNSVNDNITDTHFYLNGVGLNANNADNLTITNSEFYLNGVGLNLTNTSDFAIITDTNFYLNLVGLNADASDFATITNADVYLNGVGINLQNASDFTKINDSNVFLNLVGIKGDNVDQLKINNSNIFLNLNGVQIANHSDFMSVTDSNVFLNVTGVSADASTFATIDHSNVFLNGTGFQLTNGSDFGNVNNSQVFLNKTGVSVDASDFATVQDSNVFLNETGVQLTNNSAFGDIKHSNVFLNKTGVSADNSNFLTVENSNVFLNETGVKLTNHSDHAEVKDSNIFLNKTGISADASKYLLVDNDNIFLNKTGVALANHSNHATVENSNVFLNETGVSADDSKHLVADNDNIFLNKTGIDLTNHSNHATVKNSNVFLNKTGVHADASKFLVVANSLFAANETGVSLNNGSDWAFAVGDNFILNGTGIKADDSNNLVVAFSNFVLNDTGISLNNNSDNAFVILSNFILNKNGIKADDSDNTIVTLSNFILNDNGISLNNGSDNTWSVLNNFMFNNNGIKADDSNGLKVLLSNFMFNKTGISLNNNSDNAIVALSNFMFNDKGIHADNSDNTVVALSNFEFNDRGIDLTNGSDNTWVVLSNFMFNGTGINADDSDGLKVILSNIGLNGTGISLNNGSDNALALLDLVWGNGTGIKATDSDSLEVALSAVFGNGTGISLNNSDNDRVDYSAVFSNTNEGVKAVGSDSLTIDHSLVFSNNVGVSLDTSNFATISNSSVYDNTNEGVKAVGSSNLTVDQSKVYGNLVGISLNTSNFATISNSKVYSNTNEGVKAQLSDNLTVDQSEVYQNTDGVSLDTSNFASITDSDIHDNTNDGVKAVSSDNLTIDPTNIHGNNIGLELISSNDAQVLDSFVYDNNTGVSATDSNNLTVSNTEVHDNAVNGLYVSGGTGLHVTGSNFHDNDVSIYLFDTHGGTIDNTTIGGNSTYGMVVDGNNGPIDLTLNNVQFLGTQTEAALQFQNATTVGGVHVSGVKFLSTAPDGWRFVGVTGQLPIHVYNAGGDLDFNDTVFGDTYSVADIHLVNSTMDGFAENATFVNDGGDPFAREARVIHSYDDFALGTIFYYGYNIVVGINIGNLAADIANRTDIKEEYYHPVSTIGKLRDRPSLVAPRATTFNTALNGKVDISNGLKIIGKSIAQLAGLAPAAGDDGKTPNALGNLEPSSGPGTGKSITTANCSVNYVNTFLADGALNTSGGCQ